MVVVKVVVKVVVGVLRAVMRSAHSTQCIVNLGRPTVSVDHTSQSMHIPPYVTRQVRRPGSGCGCEGRSVQAKGSADGRDKAPTLEWNEPCGKVRKHAR